MKRRIKLLSLILCAVLGLIFFGCEGGVSGVVLYSKAKDMINPEFFDNNRVRGASYPNPEYIEGVSPWNTKYYRDTESPRERVFIVNDEETFDEIFVEGALDVDLEKETVVVYFVHSINQREYYVSSVNYEEDKTVVSVKKKRRPEESCGRTYADSVNPYQRAFVFVFKTKNVINIEVIER